MVLAYAIAKDGAAYAGRKGWWAVASVLTAAFFESCWLITIVPLLNVVFSAEKTGGLVSITANRVFHWLAIETPIMRLAFLLGLMGAVMLARSAAAAVRDVLLTALRIGFVESIRRRIATRLAEAPWDRVVGLRHARITHVMGSDVQNIGTATYFLTQCVVAFSMLSAQCFLAVSLAPGLALFCFVSMIASALALLPFLRRAKVLGQFVTDTNLKLMNATAQYLGGLKLAVSQNLQSQFSRTFSHMLREMSDRQVDFVKQNARKNLGLTAVSSLTGAVLLLVGFGWFHVSSTILIALLLILLRMSGQFVTLQQGAQQMVAILPVYDTLTALEADLAAARPTPSEGGAFDVQGNVLGDVSGTIEFRNVSFDFSDGANGGIRGVDLTIESGSFVGIFGPSGAGKTTFADLLVGLYVPKSGTITVGGAALSPEAMVQWRNRLAYVSQEPFLFYDTIRRNLLWAAPQADEAAQWAALRFADVEGAVRAMAGGLDTVVGERGSLMSGGERQRIALARALLRKPALLILDEATNALDIETECRILSRIAAMSPRPTVVMITHRRQSLSFCNKVVEFSNGRIVDDRIC